MEKMIAACGLDCRACNAYIASRTNDDALRASTAEEWAKAYGFAFTPDMINCHGCFATDGVQIGHCADCSMRLCAIEKKLPHCGACGDYPCAAVREFHAVCPPAKATLDALRA